MQNCSDSSIIELKPEPFATKVIEYDTKQKDESSKVTVDIESMLYDQVTHDINLFEFKKMKNIRKNQLKLPFLNPEYAEFLPQEVENQWFKRFNRFGLIQETNESDVNFQLVWMDYSDEDCLCLGRNKNEQYSDQVRKDWVAFSRGVRVITSKHKRVHTEDSFRLQFLKDAPILLVLHDFYQHPLCLFPLLNALNEKYNIVMPYIHDIAIISANYLGQHMKTLNVMTDKICDVIELVVESLSQQEQRISILAHGTSCQLAANVSSYKKCAKMTLLNPLGVMLPVMRAEKPSAAELSKQVYNPQNEDSFSVQSNTGITAGVLGGQCEGGAQQRDEIPLQQNHTQIEYRVVQRKSRASSLIQQPCASHGDATGPQRPSPSAFPGRKSQTLLTRRFSNASAIVDQHELRRISCEYSAGSTGKSVFERINTALNNVYEKTEVKSALLSMLGIRSIEDFKVCVSCDQLAVGGLSTARQNFMEMLPSLCVFCNLRVLRKYEKNYMLLDKEFFKAIKEIGQLARDQVELVNESATILVSSHSSLLSDRIIQNLLTIDESKQFVQCRTVLGAGHDLFDIAIEIIKGIV